MAKNRNKESTRYYSEKQENSVCEALGGKRQANSGAAKFCAGDVITETFLIECKTCMADKESFSVKKEWWEKNRLEAFQKRKSNRAIAFNFGPGQENLYIISEELMKVLVDCLEGSNGKKHLDRV